MINPFEFDIEKGIESVLYIIENGAQPTFHHISKVMYFADKEHLEKYGRFICGDSYVAMKHGPVPSGIYDLLKSVRGDLFSLFSPQQEIIEKARLSFSTKSRHRIIK
jgi:uncharacterized phage-associated protein